MSKISYKNERSLLCALLVKAREEAEFTQKQVAETGIVSQSEISKIENGQRKVEYVVLLKMAINNKNIQSFKAENMKTIKKEEAIQKIVEHELEDWVEKFQAQDLSYFEDLIRYGGVLIGFERMNKADLEEEYFDKFDEKIRIR